MEQTDVLIVGAGAVGLAVATELAQRNSLLSITLMERRERFGMETSSRNSEVIHAGIYYPTGSLKAHLCVKGKKLLYRFCDDLGVPYLKLGKLIVANSDVGFTALELLAKQALDNNVKDIDLLSRKEIVRLEPNINASKALYSPSTGIIDSYRFLLGLEWLAKQKGVLLAYRHQVIGLSPHGNRYFVYFTNPDGSNDVICCDWLVNCAGLGACEIASWLGLTTGKDGYYIYFCKGEYFSIASSKNNMISHLVYPLPMRNLEGLGVHLTRSLDGRLRLGPNAVYVSEIDYSVNPFHCMEFFEASRYYFPFIELNDLEPEFAGIRPKLQGPGHNFRDFVVKHEIDSGLKGVINLLGIESPGLTACLSIGQMVADYILPKPAIR